MYPSLEMSGKLIILTAFTNQFSINKFETKIDVESFLSEYYGVWIEKLEELLAFIEIYEEFWYNELEYEISNFKRDNQQKED